MRLLANSCLAGVAELAGFPVLPIGDDGTAGVPVALVVLAPDATVELGKVVLGTQFTGGAFTSLLCSHV